MLQYLPFTTDQLRHKIDVLYDKWGFYIILVKPDRRFKCSCFDYYNHQPNPLCHDCLGTGYKIILEKHLARYTTSGIPPITWQGIGRAEDPGQGGEGKFNYFLKYNARPIRDGLIYQVRWSLDNLRPVSLIRLCKIADILPGYGERNAQVIYYRIPVREEPMNADLRFNNLKYHEIRSV